MGRQPWSVTRLVPRLTDGPSHLWGISLRMQYTFLCVKTPLLLGTDRGPFGPGRLQYISLEYIHTLPLGTDRGPFGPGRLRCIPLQNIHTLPFTISQEGRRGL